MRRFAVFPVLALSVFVVPGQALAQSAGTFSLRIVSSATAPTAVAGSRNWQVSRNRRFTMK